MKLTNPSTLNTLQPAVQPPKGDSKMSAIAKLNEMFPSKIMKIGDEDVPTVSARTIHERLGSDTRFNDWIVRRIDTYQFKEGEDFTVLRNEYGDTGKFTAIEYEITLDMAKELGMVEGNAKGREVRQYFIAAEKEMRRLQAENFALLENKTKLLESKVKAFDAKTFEIRDRNSYLEKKRALFIDDHIIKEVTQAYEEATRELRETQDLMYSREWAEGTTKPLAKCLQKLIMARMRNILRVTKNLRKFFKGSELETEYLLNRYIDEIEVEAKHLQW